MPSKKFKNKIEDYMFDHEKIKNAYDIVKMFLICVISGALYSFGYRCFMLNPDPTLSLVGGGMAGFSQIVAKILEIFNVTSPENISFWQPIFNYLLNIPIFIIGWKLVGKRFAISTLVTVFFISFFTWVIPDSFVDLFNSDVVETNLLARSLFAGICTGIAMVIAFRNGTSTGGFDVISIAFANKKSANIGKYLVIFNGIVLIGYAVTSYIYFDFHESALASGQNNPALVLFIFSAIYLFTNALMNDFMNSRFKKAQVQIITTNENMANILISQFPHGCTVVKGKGAFTKEDKFIIYMVVSSGEVNKVVALAQRIDANSFVNVVSLNKVFGRFFIEPFK